MAWVSWAVVYLLFDLALWIMDVGRIGGGVHGLYVGVWSMQQVASVGLMGIVVYGAVRPTYLAVALSMVGSVAASISVGQSHHWPYSVVETVMEICGCANLTLGMIAAIGSTVRVSAYRLIIAGFLVIYAILMLAGADHLKTPELGLAWCVLEITAFAAWGICFVVQ